MAPWSQRDERVADRPSPAWSTSRPKSRAIFRRFGITVSILSPFSKTAPPTVTRPV